jgi:hypothetical protein
VVRQETPGDITSMRCRDSFAGPRESIRLKMLHGYRSAHSSCRLLPLGEVLTTAVRLPARDDTHTSIHNAPALRAAHLHPMNRSGRSCTRDEGHFQIADATDFSEGILRVQDAHEPRTPVSASFTEQGSPPRRKGRLRPHVGEISNAGNWQSCLLTRQTRCLMEYDEV